VVAGADQHHAAGVGAEVDLVRRGQVLDDGPRLLVGAGDLQGDDLVTAYLVGERQAQAGGQPVRPRPGGQHDLGRGEVAAVGLNGGQPGHGAQPGHGRIGVDGHAQRLGPVGVTGRCQVGVGVACLGVVADHLGVTVIEQRVHLGRFPRRQDAGVNAARVLPGEDCQHRRAVGLRAEDEVAGALPAGVAAHGLVESAEDLQALDGMVEVRLNGVVGADDGARLGSAAGADVAPLQQRHAPRAQPGQVVGRATANDPAADYDDVCVGVHAGSFLIARKGSRFQGPGAREERSSLAPGPWNLEPYSYIQGKGALDLGSVFCWAKRP